MTITEEPLNDPDNPNDYLEAADKIFGQEQETPEPDDTQEEEVPEPSEPEQEADTPSSDEEQPPDTQQSAAPELIDLGDGVQLTHDQALAYYNFDQYLKANQDLANYLANYVAQAQTGPVPTAPTVAPSEPEQPPLDLEDPNIKYLYEQNLKLQETLRGLANGTETLQQQWVRQQQEATEQIVNRAVSSFQKEHSLPDEVMSKVRTIAGQNQWLNIYIGNPQSGIPGRDPITNLVTDSNVYNGVERALELALAYVPEVQQQVKEQEVEQHKIDQTRKKKLSSLSGSRGNAPRVVQKPSTKQEALKMASAEVAEWMRGNEIAQ